MDDRHYVCERCGLKWFVPASRGDPQGELRCGGCGAVLAPRDEPFAGKGSHGAHALARHPALGGAQD